MANLFLIPFLSSFFLAGVFLFAIVKLAKNKQTFSEDKRTSCRHIHQAGISRFGGVGIILAFVVTLLLNKELVISSQLLGVLIASGAILVFGIFDDLWQMTWQRQLLFQAGVASFVFCLASDWPMSPILSAGFFCLKIILAFCLILAWLFFGSCLSSTP